MIILKKRYILLLCIFVVIISGFVLLYRSQSVFEDMCVNGRSISYDTHNGICLYTVSEKTFAKDTCSLNMCCSVGSDVVFTPPPHLWMIEG